MPRQRQRRSKPHLGRRTSALQKKVSRFRLFVSRNPKRNQKPETVSRNGKPENSKLADLAWPRPEIRGPAPPYGPARTKTGFCGKALPPLGGVTVLSGAGMSSTGVSSEVRRMVVLPASHFPTTTFVLSAEAAAEKRKRTPPRTPPGVPRPLTSQPVGFVVETSTTTVPVPL